jgi:NADH-quinone oxidoreductase subunit N
MTFHHIASFLDELVLLLGALVGFFVCLPSGRVKLAKTVALCTALAAIVVSALSLGQHATLFDGAYRVDLFSQSLKLVFALGLGSILLLSGPLQDIRSDVRPEYYLFLVISVTGLSMLVSCVDFITLAVALEVSAFPLYLLIPMRCERPGHRSQMESAIKYVMFGIAANGLMFFGMSYLFGLTGTTSDSLTRGNCRAGDDALWSLLQTRCVSLPFLDAGCLSGSGK